MTRKTKTVLAAGMLSVGSFSLWLFFRPLMLWTGLWDENLGGVDGEHWFQLINVAYLLVANVPVVVAILGAASLGGMAILLSLVPLTDVFAQCLII